MVRVLSLAIAAALVALSNAQINRFFRRDTIDANIINVCRGPGWENDLVARFTGIFFGDFTTGGGKNSLGSLAVKGNFHAPNYVVNSKHGAICEQTNSFNSYGLVVGGVVDTFNTHVHGGAYLANGGTIEEVLQLDAGCIVTKDFGTGVFDFGEVEDLLLSTSQLLAKQSPTIILESDDTLTMLRNTHPEYEILTFHSCAQSACSGDVDTESSVDHLIGMKGYWNGVKGSNQPDMEKTYVFNIPVTNGGTIKFTVNNPSNSFNACKLVYNFYPVDSNGNYVANGEFTLIRETKDSMAGFVLAPRGHIIDGPSGNFAGNVVGLDYTWQDLNNGAEILDYTHVGDCDQYIGCLPVHEHVIHTTVTLTTATSTPSRTMTWSITQNTDLVDTDDVLTYSEDTDEDVYTTTLTDCPYENTVVISSTTTEEDTDYVVTTRQITRSRYVTETTVIPGPTVIETEGDATVTETITTTAFDTSYVEVVETYTDVEVIDGTTHVIEAATTTTVIVLDPVTKSVCNDRTRTYFTGCETVNTCSGMECTETTEHEGHHTHDHGHKHKHKHHGKDDDDEDYDKDDEDDDDEDYHKDDEDDDEDYDKDDEDDDDEDYDKDDKDDDDEDWEEKHKGHHHGKDEECNEGDDEDEESKHKGHHHGKDEECHEE